MTWPCGPSPPPNASRQEKQLFSARATQQLRGSTPVVPMEHEVEPQETHCVHFTRGQQKPSRYLLRGTPLQPERFARYLGVWLDEQLSFEEHVNRIVRKARARVAMAKALIDNLVGLSPHRFLQLYITNIRTCIEYAAPAWFPKVSETRHLFDRVKRVHNMCLRTASGALMSTPIEAIDYSGN